MRKTGWGAFLIVFISIAWLFAVIFGYYIVHKPFGVENAAAILSALGDVVVASAIVVCATALGRGLLARMAFVSLLESIIFSAGLGLGILSFATLALGLVGLLNRILFWVLILGGLSLLRSDILDIFGALRTVHLSFESRFERGLAIFVAVSLVIALLFALAPPVAWDAQTYHLVEGKTAIAQGRITSPPDILYFSFPSLVEMLFAAAMLLKGDIAAQLVHYVFFVLTLGVVYAFSRRFFNLRVAWLACALLVAVPSLLTIATYAYVDLALVFYTFAAFYALMIGRERGQTRWLALAGAFAGLALGVKYTAAIVPLALLALLLLSRETRRWSSVAGLLGCTALLAAPWYLRNLAFTGNPVYPFVFGGPYWDSFRANWFSRFGTGLLNTPLGLLTAPWDATVLGREGGLGYEATIGPLLLALIPLLVFLRPREEQSEARLRELLIYAAVLYAFWLAGIAGSKLLLQTRLLFPVFPVLAVLAAVALDRLTQLDLPQFSIRRFARLVVVLVLGMTGVGYVLGFAANGDLPYLVGAETRDAYLARTLGAYGAAVNYVNTQLPAEARVLTLWEPRSYYLTRAVQPDAILDLLPHLSSKYKTAAEVAAALRSAGYTHVLLNRAGLDYQLQSGYDPIASGDLRMLADLEAGYLKQVYGNSPLGLATRYGRPGLVNAQTDAYAVYEIVIPGEH